MRNKYLILLIFFTSACTWQQQNGNELHVQGAPLLAGNHWQTTEQFVARNGERVCTVSAGEMNVTQRAHGKTVMPQVGVSTPINPGDYYRVIYMDDVHETSNGGNTFGPVDSKAIIADLMNGGIVYTEIQQREIHILGGGEFERLGNKINLEGFAAKYQECKKFVTGRARE